MALLYIIIIIIIIISNSSISQMLYSTEKKRVPTAVDSQNFKIAKNKRLHKKQKKMLNPYH